MKIRFYIKYVVYFLLLLNISCGENCVERHVESHQSEIHELIAYFKKIVPADKIVEIEFYNNSKLHRLQITQIDTFWVNKDSSYLSSYPLYFEWEIKIANIPDSILKKLNWNQQTFDELENKLDKAGCISINNENPIEIGYKRDFFVGLTSYFIYTNFDSIQLKDIQNRRTDLHFFNDSIAWNYDTGAF